MDLRWLCPTYGGDPSGTLPDVEDSGCGDDRPDVVPDADAVVYAGGDDGGDDY